MTRILDTVIKNCNHFMYTGYNFNPILIRSSGEIAITVPIMVLTNKQIQL